MVGTGRLEPVTFSPHFFMTVASSETTRSTHFKLGSLSLTSCFFTMASKAMSGVKSPVLGHAEEGRTRWRDTQGATAGHTHKTWDGRQRERRIKSELVSASARKPAPAFSPKLLLIVTAQGTERVKLQFKATCAKGCCHHRVRHVCLCV